MKKKLSYFILKTERVNGTFFMVIRFRSQDFRKRNSVFLMISVTAQRLQKFMDAGSVEN